MKIANELPNETLGYYFMAYCHYFDCQIPEFARFFVQYSNAILVV